MLFEAQHYARIVSLHSDGGIIDWGRARRLDASTSHGQGGPRPAAAAQGLRRIDGQPGARAIPHTRRHLGNSRTASSTGVFGRVCSQPCAERPASLRPTGPRVVAAARERHDAHAQPRVGRLDEVGRRPRTCPRDGSGSRRTPSRPAGGSIGDRDAVADLGGRAVRQRDAHLPYAHMTSGRCSRMSWGRKRPTRRGIPASSRRYQTVLGSRSAHWRVAVVGRTTAAGEARAAVVGLLGRKGPAARARAAAASRAFCSAISRLTVELACASTCWLLARCVRTAAA